MILPNLSSTGVSFMVNCDTNSKNRHFGQKDCTYIIDLNVSAQCRTAFIGVLQSNLKGMDF